MMHMGFAAAKGELMSVLIKGALLARHGGADGDVPGTPACAREEQPEDAGRR